MRIIVLIMLCCFVTEVFAQQNNAQELIASSQTGAADIFFKAKPKDLAKISPGNYENPTETNVRNGLPHFFNKAKAGKELKIAYIGGSITRSENQYRNQSFGFIQSMFPKTKMVGINAGVSGTDADLGACRLYDQTLKYAPDLVFIEFAVNGGYPEGMEGIVRQIIKYNANIDICFIYTLTTAQFRYYHEGKIVPVMEKLEEIAAHYNIPSVHLGMEVADLVRKKLLIDKADSMVKDEPVFSNDGVHPTEKGGDLYASAIARSLVKMQQHQGRVPAHQLPEPLFKNNWEDAKMIDLIPQMFSEGWQRIDPEHTPFLKAYKMWFPYIMTAQDSGEYIKFRFKGKAFGLFDIGGPEVGQLEVYVDGKAAKLNTIKRDRFFEIEKEGVNALPSPLNRFNNYCNNRYRGQYFLIETTDGEHEVILKISKEKADKKAILGISQQKDITENPEKYDHSVIYAGKLLLRGELLTM